MTHHPIETILAAIYVGGLISNLPVMLSFRSWAAVLIIGFLWPLHFLAWVVGIATVEGHTEPRQ